MRKDESKQPQTYDLVLGGNNPPPTSNLVLGGIEGVKKRLANQDIKQQLTALSEALDYQEEGLDVVIDIWQKRSGKLKWDAYRLLKQKTEPKVKKALQDYNPWLHLECQHELKQHSDSVRCVSICADGKRLVSSGEDRQIVFWNIKTEQVIYNIQETDTIFTVAIAPNEKTFVSRGGSYESPNCFKIWNLKTGILETTIDEYSYRVFSLAISSDSQTLVYGLEDNGIAITDYPRTITEKQRLKHPKCLPTSLAINVDKNILVSSGNAGEVRIWDLKTGKRKQILKHGAGVNCVAISPDGKTIVSGCKGKIVVIWDVDNKTAKHILKDHSGWIYDVKISPDGQTLFSAGRDKTIKIWDIETGELLNTLTGHSDWIYSLAVSSDGNTLVSGSRDNTIRIWRT